MATTAIDLLTPVHRLSVADYQRMGELGIFDETDRTELVDGVVVDMMTIGTEHARAGAWLSRWFIRRLPDELMGWTQTDVVLAAVASQLVPDFAVVTVDELATSLPEHPLLVVEVADSSLRYDRLVKARLYARSGVPEYWIVNVVNRQIEVHRGPEGDTFADRVVLGEDAELAAPMLDGASFSVGDLMRFACDGRS